MNNHIISHDLLGSSVVKHYVAARPQCPTCGSRKLRDPRRAPKPIELGPGAKLVMTSGGYRTVSSRATVARFRKHVSPLTGVVTRLERIEADLPMNTNYFAGHNFSAPALTLDALRAGLTGGSFGKGSTAEQAEASALMEAIERYSGIFQGDEIRMTRRFTDFPPGDAILPNDVQLFSDVQYQAPNDEPDDSHPVPAPFDPSAKIEWSPVWSLRDQRFKYLPTSLLYFFYGGPGALPADTNGCAAGNTLEEAIVQGFLELVERDAYAIWWYNRSQRAEVDLSQFDDSYIRDLHTQLADTGRRLWVLDITSDLGVPTYVAILHWMQNGHENIEFGSGAHFDRRIALLRTLTELNQFLSIGLMGGGTGEKPSLDGTNPLHLREHPFLTPSGNPADQPTAGTTVGFLHNTRGQVDACVEIARRAGLDFLVLDQTRPDVEVPVVRVIVPGLRHFYRRFAPGRLYDVPVKLGLRDHRCRKANLLRSFPIAEGDAGLRAPAKKNRRRTAPPVISARLGGPITLETRRTGAIAACFDGYSVGLGKFSAAAAERAQALRTGLPLASFATNRAADKEVGLLVRRLAQSGLLEYRFGSARADQHQVVIEPQVSDYWPKAAKLGDKDVIALSRFAYLRRRGNEMVLESPRAGALFRICDPRIAAALALLSKPQKISALRRQPGFVGLELLALLVDCQILFKIDAPKGDGLRPSEGDDNLVLWDFHDLLFHTHSTEGRQANPLGGVYPYAGRIPPPPAVRPHWQGKKIDLRKFSITASKTPSPFVSLLHERHSTRDFDDARPVTLAELARFLDHAARIRSTWKSSVDMDNGGPEVSYAARPYPSGGSAYELELYLTVGNCEGLTRGFYHYDADLHALVPIAARAQELDAQLMSAEFAMGASAPPQILITIAARFARVSWKYSSVAYSLILKDVGVLLQTLYLTATDMGLGGCAIGTNNIDQFAKMTGLEFHVEGPVGQFALGRPGASDALPPAPNSPD